MQITVPLVIDIPDDAGIEQVESVVLDADRLAMCEAMRAVVAGMDAGPIVCPTCHGRTVQRDGTATRLVSTRFGRVSLVVRRVRCAACGQRCRPSAPLLAALGRANLTPGLRQTCVLAGSSWPFATAACVIADRCGAVVSAEHLRQVTRAAGHAAAGDGVSGCTRRRTTCGPRATSYARTRPGSRSVSDPAPPACLPVGRDGG